MIFLEGEISVSEKNKTITLQTDNTDKVVLKNVIYKPLSFKERTLPLKIAKYEISNPQSLPSEFNINDNITKREINSNWSLKIIAITIGGWLPAGFTPCNSHYLLDKNIFNILKVRYSNGEVKDSIDNDFFDLKLNDKLIINPSLFMLEGNSQSYDRTKIDLAKKYEEAILILNKTLPNSIIPHDCKTLTEATFGMLCQLYSSNRDKLSFIQSIIPHIYKETAIKKRKGTIKILQEIAILNKIERKSILFIAALSAALSNPKSNSAKKIFKPKPAKDYTKKNAYNALSDFRAMDYLMWASAINPEVKSYLCTNDKNLVRFWCAIEPKNLMFIGTRLSFDLKFKENLFGNLSDEEFQWVIDSIN